MISREIAQIIYDLYIVNDHILSIQADNGIYYKKNVPITPYIINKMIDNKGSMGCYQQCYHTDRLRWLCFDFDCKDKDNPDIDGLYRECVRPLTEFLDNAGIMYLTEFSGRRGIHVWIILNQITTKYMAFHFMDKVLLSVHELCNLKDSDKWAIDRFPKTDSGTGNIVGSQVKIPLSMHKNGGRSFFFKGYYLPKEDVESESFYLNQLSILSEYRMQSMEELCKKIGLNQEHNVYQNSKRYTEIEGLDANLEEIIACLEETRVYHELFQRMRLGRAQQYDWLVLLGTFTPFDSDGNYLVSLFRKYPNYDVEKTIYNIKKFKNKYYPATFRYLYSLYHLDMEMNIKPDDTGVDYLCFRLGGSPIHKEWDRFRSERLKESELQRVLIKEQKYLWDNDEVPSVTINNKLQMMKRWELNSYEKLLNSYSPLSPTFNYFIRHEERKDRVLVSLYPQDRLVTTAMALRLYHKVESHSESYSYRVSEIDKDYLFYHWYSSWARFIAQIRVYMDLPFMQDSYLFYVDLKQCYPNVDLLNVYRAVEGGLDDEGKKIFLYLSEYNDRLMRVIQNGNRIGVPQGPAYARILAEIYLDFVLKAISADECKSEFRVFRYVDDIVVICDGDAFSKDLFYKFLKGFELRGMPINREKTRYFGQISQMSMEDKRAVLHTDNFNYDLSLSDEGIFFDESDKNEKLQRYILRHAFDIKNLGYIYGNRTFEVAKHYYFYKYGMNIMSSRIGRGKNFRHFYEYVLENSDRIKEAIKNSWFHMIPKDTVNYSNFIITLYYYIREGRISETDVRRIAITYLDNDFDSMMMSDEDIFVTQAIVEWIRTRD